MSESSRRGSHEGNVGKGDRSAVCDKGDALLGRIAQIEHLEESYCLAVSPEGRATMEMRRRTTRVVGDQVSATTDLECASEDVDIDPPQVPRAWRLWLRAAAGWIVDALIRRLPNVL